VQERRGRDERKNKEGKNVIRIEVPSTPSSNEAEKVRLKPDTARTWKGRRERANTNGRASSAVNLDRNCLWGEGKCQARKKGLGEKRK